MNKVFILPALMLLSQTAAAGGILEETGVGINKQMGVYTSYLWRGFELNDEAVQQVGLDVSYGGLTAGIWTNSDLTYKEDIQSKEIDYYLELNRNLGDFSFSAGHTYYVFPNEESYTGEFFLGVSYETLPHASFTWFQDYMEGTGNYFSAVLTLPLALSRSVSADFILGTSINDNLFIEGQGGDISSSVIFNIPFYDGLNFTPSLQYSVPFGDMTDYEENSFCGGIDIGYGF